jgi:hypothetical protein
LRWWQRQLLLLLPLAAWPMQLLLPAAASRIHQSHTPQTPSIVYSSHMVATAAPSTAIAAALLLLVSHTTTILPILLLLLLVPTLLLLNPSLCWWQRQLLLLLPLATWPMQLLLLPAAAGWVHPLRHCLLRVLHPLMVKVICCLWVNAYMALLGVHCTAAVTSAADDTLLS